jgi:transcriptional regulator with XRE-family HTH domain
MNTGERIKQARKKAGITQKELGNLVGMSYQQIAQYEKGIRKPKLETLSKIAEALNVLSSDLLDGTVFLPQLNQKTVELFAGKGSLEISTDYTKINYLYDCLNEKGQDKAIEQVELLTKIPEYQKKDENTHILVNAAHARTDIEVTEEMKKHDDDIMNDENF